MRSLLLLIALAPMYLSGQDKLVTPGGDTLDCRITAADEYVIQFVTEDEQKRKIPRKSVKSVYYDGRWLRPFTLPAAINQVQADSYDVGMLREDTPMYPAALHLDKAGAYIIGSVSLTAAAIILASFFGDELWGPYATGGMGIGAAVLYVASAFKLRRAAYELSHISSPITHHP